MRIISKKKIRDYCFKNTHAKIPLTEWYYKMSDSTAENIMALKKEFNSVDSVNGYSIFNIGGNKYRLITAIHYNTQLCYVRRIWTHAEYSKQTNEDKVKKGEL